MLLKGVALAAFCVFVWGVTFVNTKALLADFSALEIQVLRFAVACFVLLGIEKAFRLKAPDPATVKGGRWLYAGLGLWGVFVYQLLENCAIHYTSASNVSILVGINPVVTALLAWLCGEERRPRVLFFIGFLVAITGVVMVSWDGLREFHFRPVGDLMALGAMLSWGFYSLLVGRVKHGSQVAVMRRAFCWSLLMMVPFVLFGMTPAGRTAMDGSFAVTLDGAANLARFGRGLNYVNLGFLGLFASAGCFVFWNQACARLGIVRCTVGIYLVPAVTVLFAWACLGEHLTAVSATGACLTFVGVVLSNLRSGKD